MNAGFSNHRLSEITSDGKRLYASSTYEGLFGGVFVSSDGGLQWSLRANEEALHGRNLHSLTASPAKRTILFAASEDAILKSVDGGKTWSALPAPRIMPHGTGQPFGRRRTRSHSCASRRFIGLRKDISWFYSPERTRDYSAARTRGQLGNK